jgi:hypothetical protein
MFWKIWMEPNFNWKFYDKCHKIEVKVGYSAQREPSYLLFVLWLIIYLLCMLLFIFTLSFHPREQVSWPRLSILNLSFLELRLTSYQNRSLCNWDQFVSSEDDSLTMIIKFMIERETWNWTVSFVSCERQEPLKETKILGLSKLLWFQIFD